MRKIIYTLLALTTLFSTTACNDYETYGELKEKERDNIEQFINDSSFVIIGEDQFHSQGDMTIGDKQFVRLTKSGVYMQIVRKGCGEKIKDGESLSINCRFWEISIQDFIEGLMLNQYGSSVPEAWLVPLPYINIGRLVNPDDETARVKMIVPHSQGTTSNAKSNVKPYYYDITFQRGR